MVKPKMVYVSEAAHRRLKLLAARRSRPMGELLEEIIDKEIEDEGGIWTGSEGLALQEKALAEAWDDPNLDVYDHAGD